MPWVSEPRVEAVQEHRAGQSRPQEAQEDRSRQGQALVTGGVQWRRGRIEDLEILETSRELELLDLQASPDLGGHLLALLNHRLQAVLDGHPRGHLAQLPRRGADPVIQAPHV
jgi:hypothetical protein